MLLKTQGIVLHKLRINDQRLIVKIFSRHTGLYSFLVRSSRKGKSTALFQPLNILLLESRWQETKNLQSIKECSVDYQYRSLPYHPDKRAMAMMMNEFMIKCLHEGEANEGLFVYLMQSLIMLDQLEKPDPDFHIKFIIHLAQWLGVGIQTNHTPENTVFSIREGSFISIKQASDPNYCFSENASLYLATLIKGEKKLLNHLERNELLKNLIRYYQVHVPGFTTLRSHNVLAEVFDSPVSSNL